MNLKRTKGQPTVGKKFTVEDLRNDLAKSWDLGTTIEVKKIWAKRRIIENLKIKLIISILCIPKFQKIINSLFSSYLIVM